MNFFRITRRVFLHASMALLAVSMPAQTQKALKGSYILAEEGLSNSGPVSILAQLTFNENGVVTGTEMSRSSAGVQAFQVSGNYNLDGSNLGSLSLFTTTTGPDDDVQTTAMTYKFVTSASQILLIRTNSGSLTSGTLFPSATGFSGTFAYSDLREENSAARVVTFTVDSSGNITGFAGVRSGADVSLDVVRGSYNAGENGIGSLTFATGTIDADGNDTTRSDKFAAVAAKDRAIMMRLSGPIELIPLSR